MFAVLQIPLTIWTESQGRVTWVLQMRECLLRGSEGMGHDAYRQPPVQMESHGAPSGTRAGVVINVSGRKRPQLVKSVNGHTILLYPTACLSHEQ